MEEDREDRIWVRVEERFKDGRVGRREMGRIGRAG